MRSRAVRLHPRWAVADLKRDTCYTSLAVRPVFARYTAFNHMPLVVTRLDRLARSTIDLLHN
jgi:hypothetical protein